MDKSLAFELWLDAISLQFGPSSRLVFGEQDPGLFVADSMLFFNRTPKEDIFEGILDASLSLRLVYNGTESKFNFQQSNLALQGKVLHPRCLGGKINQANLMMDFIENIDTTERAQFSRHPIEGKYRIHSAQCDTKSLGERLKSAADFSSFNPHFFESELSRILRDKRFWMKPKITFSGKFPTNTYLPVASQLDR